MEDDDGDADPPSSSNPQSKNQFTADYDKRGQASCKRCKQKITKGAFRLGKVAPNPFSETGGEMKQWFHPNCLFEAFSHGRTTSAKITQLSDVDGYKQLKDADRDALEKLIEGLRSTGKLSGASSSSKSPRKDQSPQSKIIQHFPTSPSPKKLAKDDTAPSAKAGDKCPDGLFSSFCELCNRIADEASYKSKTDIVHDFLFRRGATGKHGYCGDPNVLLKLLLPGEKGLDRVFNMNNKQMIKIFADIFGANAEAINDATNEHGDISVIISDKYFVKSETMKPVSKCQLTLEDVDAFLDSLTQLTKYDDQLSALRKFTRSCGVAELRYTIRLLKKDLRMNARARHILDAVSSTAYDAFQHSRDLKAICRHITTTKSPDGSPTLKKDLSVKVNLMMPIQPMLAEACKSVEYAIGKCPKGMFAEIKYDGERVQVHHSGNQFNYYSRSLKPVLPHKVSYLSEAIPKAFPTATDLILDGEIVLVDTTTHLPLPFGTLGVHKGSAFKKAQVCIFVFDILHLNGQSLMGKTLAERKEALRNVMTEIPDRVVLSEIHRISKPAELQDLLDYVFTEGLEGLVLKPVDSLYEPGKRHWLKMKKDYLEGGAMADSADLIVLGAYYGTGNKGGLMSVFLLGVYDPVQNKYLTVTKCGNGHDDNTLARLQKELDMVRINKDPGKVPSWLVVKNAVVPDFVIRDPKKSQVWEITGAEFSKAEVHTADGISIRFPRVTKIRDDKDWQSATSLEELKVLFKNSRQQAPKLQKQEKPASKGGKEEMRSSSSSPEKEKQVKRKLFSAKKDDDSDLTVSYDGKEDKARPSTSTAAVKSPAKRQSSSSVKAPVASPPKKPKSEQPEPAKEKKLDWEPADIFTGCHFYLDKSISDSKTRDSMFRSVTAYGAASVCSLPTDSRITHCIVGEKCTSVPSSTSASAKCVRLAWLSACVGAKKLVDPASYLVH